MKDIYIFSFLLFDFFPNKIFAYRDEYPFTTPGLFTLYTIADEGIYYRAPLPMVKSLCGLFFPPPRRLVVYVMYSQTNSKKKEID